MVFHRSLSDSKSPQVSRTLLSILAVLTNAVVWMISTRPCISKSSNPFIDPLLTVPRAPISYCLVSIQDTRFGRGVFPLCRDAVSVLNSSNRPGNLCREREKYVRLNVCTDAADIFPAGDRQIFSAQ